MTDPTIKAGGKNTDLHHLYINTKSMYNKQEELERLMNNKKWIMAGIAESGWNGSWDWKIKIDDDNLHFKEKIGEKKREEKVALHVKIFCFWL